MQELSAGRTQEREMSARKILADHTPPNRPPMAPSELTVEASGVVDLKDIRRSQLKQHDQMSLASNLASNQSRISFKSGVSFTSLKTTESRQCKRTYLQWCPMQELDAQSFWVMPPSRNNRGQRTGGFGAHRDLLSN